MSDPAPDDIRRRVERLEQAQVDLTLLLRDNTTMTARLNETLLELKEELKVMRAVEKDVANLKFGFAAIKWLAMAIGGSGTAMALAYLFKVPV